MADSKDKNIHIRLPQDVHKRLRVKCAYDDESIQSFVERVIKESLASYEVEKADEKTNA